MKMHGFEIKTNTIKHYKLKSCVKTPKWKGVSKSMTEMELKCTVI